jgi:hypothetical protein
MEKKVCRACLIEKSMESFHSCKNCRNGKLNICKICKTQGRNVDKSDKVHPFNKTWRSQNDIYSLRSASKEDYEKMWEILRLIGYDTTGDVHRQFLDKINLNLKRPIKYRKKNKENQPRYLFNGEVNPKTRNPPNTGDL